MTTLLDLDHDQMDFRDRATRDREAARNGPSFRPDRKTAHAA
jgi:hypothetical protein